MSLTRVRQPNPIRAALEQAMVSPRVQHAVSVFVTALVDEGEAILRQRYAGETLRMHVPKRGSRDDRVQRDMRIRALAAAPSNLTPAAIARDMHLSVRQVQRVLAVKA